MSQMIKHCAVCWKDCFDGKLVHADKFLIRFDDDFDAVVC